jgi:alpha-mannosidase
MGHPDTAGETPLYRFKRADVVVRDEQVTRLVSEVEVLRAVMKTLPTDSPKRHQILRSLERAIDALDLSDVVGTAQRARTLLAPMLSLPAEASAHRFAAVGHAHIDTAWLWPLAEARRKVARTFTNLLALLDANPDAVVACSQPQHYAWFEVDHPELFDQLSKHVARGAWSPVGAMWVEPDCNLPSGESLLRQLVHGKRYFLDRFGMDVTDVWLPDAFGFPASLPQIMRHGGCESFMTAKLGWNETNQIPHDSFWWEGIDGTRVFAHLPPADTYSGTLHPAELARASRTFAEKGVANTSLMPFGYGDGGGGPTQDMIDRARLLQDLEGSPRVTMQAPADFYSHARQAYPDAPIWRGELYFERHRGIHTTQRHTKQLHKRLERQLREAELWIATAGADSWRADHNTLQELWRVLLVHQFHDILPGSSTAWVHEQAEHALGQACTDAEQLVQGALQQLVGTGSAALVVNSSDLARAEVVSHNDRPRWACAPPMGISPLNDEAKPGVPVRATATNLRNEHLDVTIGDDGTLVAVIDLSTGRNLIAAGRKGNELRLHQDVPIMSDAWDVDATAYRQYTVVTEVTSIDVIEAEPLRGSVRVRRALGKASTIEQTYQLSADARRLDIVTEVDWQEDDTLLTAAFTVDVRSDECRYGIQFGHVGRPVHTNTSWDQARFEVAAHGWAHLAEAGFGVALLDDGIYGHGCQGNELRLSLIRSPGYPDPKADRGQHRFTYAIMASNGTVNDVIDEAERLQTPLRIVHGDADQPVPTPLVSVSGAKVSAVKRADADAGDLIVRCWEPRGGRTQATVAGQGWTRVQHCDALERPLTPPRTDPVVPLAPFEIVTLRLTPVDPEANRDGAE